jgi:hypothetical protein
MFRPIWPSSDVLKLLDKVFQNIKLLILKILVRVARELAVQ